MKTNISQPRLKLTLNLEKEFDLIPNVYAKAIYTFLVLRIRKYDDFMHVSRNEIADRCKISEKTVSRQIRTLEDLGMIGIRRKKGKDGAVYNEYKLLEIGKNV
jgi:DNA-binding HxlR family transcriptional regulator